MIKVLGSMLCKDCVQCVQDLNQAGVDYHFFDFADNLQNLKDFLAIRDSNPVFRSVRLAGAIGIPCIVREDGSVTLEWAEYM